MTYSVGQDQTASVKFGLKLFASILQYKGRYVRQIFAADNFLDALSERFKGKGQGRKFETEYRFCLCVLE